MINIQVGPMSSLKKDMLALLHLAVKEGGRVPHVFFYTLSVLPIFRKDRLQAEPLFVQAALQAGVLQGEIGL